MLSEGSFCCDERLEGGIWLFQDIWSLQKGTPSSQKVTSRKPLSSRMYIIFQSTPSSQKVTGDYLEAIEEFAISIHTFLTEGDSNSPQQLPHSLPPIINYIVQYSPTKSIAIFLLPILSFSRCESPGIFMHTSDSHQLTTLLSPFYLRRNPFTISQPGNLPQALSQSPTHTSYDSLYSDNISDQFPYPGNFQLAWDRSTVSAGQKSYSLPRMLWYRQ